MINKDIIVDVFIFLVIVNDSRLIIGDYLNVMSSCCGFEEVIYIFFELLIVG